MTTQGPDVTILRDDEGKAATIARAACGCCVAVMVVPEPNASAEWFHEFAKELRRWRRRGYVREDRTVGWVRHTPQSEGGLGCDHFKLRYRKKAQARQLSLGGA